MGYPPHFLLQFGGSIGNPGLEIWSCGIRMWIDGDDVFAVDPDDYLATVASPALITWFESSATKISTSCFLQWSKFNEIDEDGHYANPSTNELIYGLTANPGGGGSSVLPWQSSVCLTWLTDARERGIASKGRIFMPLPTLSVNSNTGLFPTGDATSIATSTATFLNTLDIGGLGVGGTGVMRPGIVSRGKDLGGGAWGDGAREQINSVQVDNRIDIQRRRAEDLTGVRSTVVVPY